MKFFLAYMILAPVASFAADTGLLWYGTRVLGYPAPVLACAAVALLRSWWKYAYKIDRPERERVAKLPREEMFHVFWLNSIERMVACVTFYAILIGLAHLAVWVLR